MNILFVEKFRIKELELFDFNYWIVSVRPHQPTVGSLIITLKRNCKSLSELTIEETKELSIVFLKTENLLKEAFSNDKINFLCLMMVDDQVHFHMIPRYEKTLIFNNKCYDDIFWPKPIDISKVIEEDNLELKVLKHLNKHIINHKVIVGYTTGVYDLFHIGHLNLLKRAKSECDYLIVGVTSDELSLSRKGKTPIIPLIERLEIVKNISFVNKVVIQDDMDKLKAWETHKFDKMFVGSDWKGTDKWNQIDKDFAKLGVKIVYFPYTDSTSSTLLRSVLNNIIN